MLCQCLVNPDLALLKKTIDFIYFSQCTGCFRCAVCQFLLSLLFIAVIKLRAQTKIEISEF